MNCNWKYVASFKPYSIIGWYMLQRIWLMSQEVFWCALFSSFTISLFLSFYRILLLIAIRNTIDNTYVSTIYPYDSIIQSAHEYVIFIRRDEMDWNGLSRAEILEWDWNRFSSHIVLFLYVYVNRRKKNRYWIHVEIMCIILLYIFFSSSLFFFIVLRSNLLLAAILANILQKPSSYHSICFDIHIYWIFTLIPYMTIAFVFTMTNYQSHVN